jgi:Fe-S cluster assembly iron-binding protein IscA
VTCRLDMVSMSGCMNHFVSSGTGSRRNFWPSFRSARHRLLSNASKLPTALLASSQTYTYTFPTRYFLTMAQPVLRSAFRSARPVRTSQHDPVAFFHSSRIPPSSLTPPPSHRASGHHASPLRPHPSTLPHSSYTTAVRPFSSTPTRPATAVLLNPRVDDDGAPMTITISDRAAKRLKQITSTPQKRNTLAKSPVTADSHLRVTVTSGGCHGFQYLMSLEPKEKVDVEEDTVFTAAAEGGGEAEVVDEEGQVQVQRQREVKGKAEVVMDQPSLELLKGSTVDFVTELIGSQFKIVGNPRASSSCGCGTSFDIQ